MVDERTVIRTLAHAIDVFERARTALDEGTRDVEEWRVVDGAARRLEDLAAASWTPRSLEATLLDWRDRLGSFALTARALADAELSREYVHRLLERGIAETSGDAHRRLDEACATLAGRSESVVS